MLARRNLKTDDEAVLSRLEEFENMGKPADADLMAKAAVRTLQNKVSLISDLADSQRALDDCDSAENVNRKAGNGQRLVTPRPWGLAELELS